MTSRDATTTASLVPPTPLADVCPGIDGDPGLGLAAVPQLFGRFESREALLRRAGRVADGLLGTEGCRVAPLTDEGDAPTDDGLTAAVRVHGEVAARLQLPGPQTASRRAVRTVCDLIGAALEKHQTRQLLEARYVSWTLARHNWQGKVGRSLDRHVLDGVRDPESVARRLARSFFGDLRQAGFEAGAIVSAASEIIASLTRTLQESR